MRVLMVQFVDPGLADPQPEFRHELGVLGAVLSANGFECRLTAMAGYRPAALRAAMIQHRPAAVLVDIDPHSVTASHRTIVDIAEKYSLPVVVCGAFATCSPSQAISIAGVHALLLGECEQSAVAVLTALRDSAEIAPIAGAWINSEDGLIKGPVLPLVENLDSLPLADRAMFDGGKPERAPRTIPMRVARGCPLWCASCVNDWYMDLYSGKGTYVRRRSVGHVLDEVRSLRKRYNQLQSIEFQDHCFAADAAWLAEFAEKYAADGGPAYGCTAPIPFVTPQSTALLRSSGCRRVRTNIGSGSRFIREEILSMHTSNEQIITACRTLRAAGIEVTAEVFVGSPYESPITVDDTMAMLHKAEVDHAVAKVFYPTPGTRAAELCDENSWVSGRGEENYWLNRSVLDMPSMKGEQVNMVAARFGPMLRRGGRGVLERLLAKLNFIRRRHTDTSQTPKA